MKVLVTGGAGFIGSHIVDGLVKEGYEVVIVDDLSTGFDKNINPKAKFYKTSICNEKKINDIFKKEKPDVVDHHAAQMDVRRSTREPLYDAKMNILGSLTLLQGCLKNNIKKFIYANSAGASYGEPKHLPMDENHPINAVCEYGISKHTVEHYLYLYNHNYGLNYVSLRYPNVYGPRQEPENEAGVVSIFVSKMLNGERPIIFGDGTQSRDFVFVSDVVKANLLALKNFTNDCYNLGSRRGISVEEVFQTIRKKLNSNLKPIYSEERVGELSKCYFTYDKLKRDFGWVPKVSFEKGVEIVVDYWKERLKK
jgi:UDP-glucose 4-epimerase